MGLFEILGVDLEKEIENKMVINKKIYENIDGILTKVTKNLNSLYRGCELNQNVSPLLCLKVYTWYKKS